MEKIWLKRLGNGFMCPLSLERPFVRMTIKFTTDRPFVIDVLSPLFHNDSFVISVINSSVNFSLMSALKYDHENYCYGIRWVDMRP